MPLWETETLTVWSSSSSQPYTADGVTGTAHTVGTWRVWLTLILGFEHESLSQTQWNVARARTGVERIYKDVS